MAVTDDPALMRLLTKIYEEKGWDLTQYREASLLRRLQSRLLRNDIHSLDEYVRYLETHPQEYIELLNALTINVTEFFRNPAMFRALRSEVIPRIIAEKQDRQHRIIRAWSCGCASGDEPYSLAILFLEALGQRRDQFLLTVIGSDIDQGALEEARNVVYTKDRLKAIDEVLLKKYFDKLESGNYKVKGMVSNLVKLRHHDVNHTSPYMHCDLILCRNLLIYFNKQLQEEVVLKFYECLNSGGYLILGMTEGLVGAAANAFEALDHRLRIYRRPLAAKMQYDKAGILPQAKIDQIIRDMTDK